MTEKMARPCWDPKAGTIKWIPHPNGPTTIPDSTTPHVDWRNLSANHKGALAAMVAETAKYAGGVTPQSGVYPALGSVSHRQTVGAWHRNQDEISFQWPEPVFQWRGSSRPIDGRRCQTTVSSLSTAFE